ncbi:MAG: low molecular weight protein-tyrosine-phosphatase [Wenzhouxiangellaceae bacterium]
MKLLFVCMGNICRSPTAKAVVDRHLRLAGLHEQISTDSAGTHGYHIGEPPDERAQAVARRSGMDISQDLARQLVAEDFTRYDLILVMDERNHRDASRVAPAQARARLRLMMEYAPDYGLHEVPDPYYGGEEGFLRVVDMLDRAAEQLVLELRQQLQA